MALLLFVGGARMGHFIALGAMCLPMLVAKIEKWRYALSRLTAFLHPGKRAGAGELPAATSRSSPSAPAAGSAADSARECSKSSSCRSRTATSSASNVGEEWGFLGLAAITIAFALYALLGFRIARQARSPFLQLVAVGLTFTTVLTAFLHIGVVIGLLPTTGLTLPFVSYGRSNLVLTMLFTGILVNIGSTRERVIGQRGDRPAGASAA